MLPVARQGAPVVQRGWSNACTDEEGCGIDRAAKRAVEGTCHQVAYRRKGRRRSTHMARGREKDRKVRKKHRKNIQRMKALAKSRRMKRGGKK